MKSKKIFSLMLTCSLILGIAAISPQCFASAAVKTTTSSSVTFNSVAENNSIYVSPDASDNGAGTINDPTSLTSAINKIGAGETIYLQSGTYKISKELTIPYTNNGTENAMKSMVALDSKKVIFDFTAESYNMKDTSLNDRGVQLDGSYWHLKGIQFYNAADNGLYVTGKHNIVESCVAKANRDTGIQIGRRASSLSNKADWPSDNLILNCTSYNNSDPATGENADGFAAKLTCGEGNVFDGCISYNNVDDGWDLFSKTETGQIGGITIKNSVSFRNGYTTSGQYTKNSDGNGFKLGGSDMPGNHTISNCIAFENKKHGITDNSNPGVITADSCTSFNNAAGDGKASNIDLARDKTNSNNILKNIVSFSTKKVGSDKYKGTVENSILYNTNKYYSFTEKSAADSRVKGSMGTVATPVTANDFISIESPKLGEDVDTLWRNSDGSINTGNFLKINPNSKYSKMGASLNK